MKDQIYLTKDGLEELKKEHEGLIKARRPEIVERVSQARNLGDLSENAEYVAAREELSFIDGRIGELEELLKHTKLIQANHTRSASKRTVDLGSKVTLHKDGKKEVYLVVGEWEADPAEKKISHESPLGKALIGRKVGDKVEVEAPAGRILYKIVDIG